MRSYYDGLSAERLRRCYELAPPQVQAYLESEVQFIRGCIEPGARVLELGCGYGRVIGRLAKRSCLVVGIDSSFSSLEMAKRELPEASRIAVVQMNVEALAFLPGSFDLVCCPQNGISAFRADQRALLSSTVRLLAPGGTALFFSYAESFWVHRLAWFRLQAANGLIGELDESATRDGTIVCKDGFVATTVSPTRFLELSSGLGSVSVSVLNESSVVCTIRR